jgi:hypothetical protein
VLGRQARTSIFDPSTINRNRQSDHHTLEEASEMTEQGTSDVNAANSKKEVGQRLGRPIVSRRQVSVKQAARLSARAVVS